MSATRNTPPWWRETDRLPPRFTDARKVYGRLPKRMKPGNGPYTVLLDGDAYVREIHIWHVGTARSLHFILPGENGRGGWVVTRRTLGDAFGREMQTPDGRLDGYRLLCPGGSTTVIGP